MPDVDHIREILDQFGPTAVLDLLLIAAAIYGALRLVSGTRASTWNVASLPCVVWTSCRVKPHEPVVDRCNESSQIHVLFTLRSPKD